MKPTELPRKITNNHPHWSNLIAFFWSSNYQVGFPLQKRFHRTLILSSHELPRHKAKIVSRTDS